MRFITLFLAMCLLTQPAISIALEPAEFAQNPDYLQVKLSPDGKKLGVVMMNKQGLRNLVVLSVPGFKVIGGAKLGKRNEVGKFYWVNDERLLIEVLKRRAWQEKPSYMGELFAIDYDGSKPKLVYGYRAGMDTSLGTSFKRTKATQGWASVLNLLRGDDEHVLISSKRMSRERDKHPTVHKLNVYDGDLSPAITSSPVPTGKILTNSKGEIKFAHGRNADANLVTYRYVEGKWQAFSGDFGSGFSPLALDKPGKKLFYLAGKEEGRKGLFSLDLSTGESTSIYTDETVDIASVNFTTDRDSVYALRLDSGYPTYVMFNDEGEEASIFKSLLATFSDNSVSITSRSRDGKKWILRVRSDIDHSSYFLFDREAKSVARLFTNFDHIDKNKLAKTQPITFASFDGMTLHGYITYPNHAAANNPVPLVTLVHGGPHGVRDTWYFNSQVQMLAAQGYAVLQVNYRGSAGYGTQFLQAGYREWGGAIQKDIISGTQWAIEQGKIDADKVCIMGTSFGAYSAVMSATMAPKLFKCVVANAGLYDLEMAYSEGDVQYLYYGKKFLEKVIGNEPERLKSDSPVNHVHKLRAAIFIAHGEQDQRTPIEQAEALKKALDRHNKPYEWFVKRAESHGFYDEENREEYFTKVAEFLARHLE